MIMEAKSEAKASLVMKSMGITTPKQFAAHLDKMMGITRAGHECANCGLAGGLVPLHVAYEEY
jgi:hypothetical protein